ncbi:uncharacterized protein BDR25DRAFT_237367 [Lindgomyces ingoldianus]|uniref:Uncharacterized protein n=1 Tax=Lindgomyces ingoldianus TaxID=673940 RepID=A0ACB6QHW1_9PLEO|nr:uncharacterized protein BDR25DRAFT_237367 [Lindgomyces ingoldianus]KAF2466466.1 hypothetical protein BDR25DRAFT_237367 [Lindgomyces ingoldianus]
MSPNLQLSFWKRMGLEEEHRDLCLRIVRDLYPRYKVEESKNQGYCSFTILVSPSGKSVASSLHNWEEPLSTDIAGRIRIRNLPSFIVQLRPPQHTLDLTLTHAAVQTYGPLAPSVQPLACNLPCPLHAFQLDKIPGIPFSHQRPHTGTLNPSAYDKQATLIKSLAIFLAKAWPAPSPSHPSTSSNPSPRTIRADSPLAETPEFLLSQCSGNVGARLIPKLKKLSLLLPHASLRARAADTLAQLLELRDYPIVLNHGDLIPSNIMLDPETWALQGVVDWAEAEYLPFGTCFYGLEHFLGYLDMQPIPNPNPNAIISDPSPPVPVFRYYTSAPQLRKLFWETLVSYAPGIQDRINDVMLAKDVGVLLWYGFAWDEGAIDRVVNVEEDREEMECLRAFLEGEGEGEGDAWPGGGVSDI